MPRLKTSIRFADVMQKDQHSESLQICVVKVSAGRALQRTSNCGTFSQGQKACCNVGHVVQQRMRACQLSRFVARELAPSHEFSCIRIIDLRLKLGCESAEYNTFTVVVVLNVRGRVVGAVVDSVSDVLELSKDNIKPSPEMSTSMDANFITGIGTIKSGQGETESERMLILMDIEGLMSSSDMGLINA